MSLEPLSASPKRLKSLGSSSISLQDICPLVMTGQRGLPSGFNDTPNYVINLIFGRSLIVSKLRKNLRKLARNNPP